MLREFDSSLGVPITDENDVDLPIALHKGKRSYHPIQNFVSYHQISPKYHAFLSRLSDEHIPSHVGEALKNPKLQVEML